MADIFDEVAVQPPAQQTAQPDVFDTISVNPVAERQAFERQYVAEQRPDFIRTSTTPLRLGYDTLQGLISSLGRGVEGAGTIAGSSNPLGNLVQTGLEVIPQAAFGLENAIKQGARFAFDNPVGAARNVAATILPPAVAIPELIMGRPAPSRQEIDDAFARSLTNQAVAQQQSQQITNPVFGEANVPLAQSLPDVIATLMASPELATGAVGLASRIPSVAGESVRTAATLASTPRTAYQATGAAQPYLSGAKLASAEEGLGSALAGQASLERSLAEQGLKTAATLESEAAALAATRGEAATVGREALQAGRELRTAESTLQPQIINAQTTLDQVAQSPVVVLGKTAQDPAAFGRTIIEGVEKPLEASKKVYQQAYDSVKESLPATQPTVEARNLFDAASNSKLELSQGFEAFNQGKIRRMLDESTQTTASVIPQEIRNLYENASPSVKSQMLQQYPQLDAAAVRLPAYTWDELQARFRQVNEGMDQAIKHGDTGDVRILSQLKSGLVDDMEAYTASIGGDTFSLFQDANKLYKGHQDRFGLNRVQSILKDDVIQNPQLVASKLINDNNAPMVNAVKGLVTPEEFQAVQAQFSQKLFSPNVDTAFDPSHFMKQFSDRGSHETYRAVYGDAGFRQLEQIYDASKGFDKISEFQKTLDGLQKEAATTGEAFAKRRGRVTEAEAVQTEKNKLRDALRPLQEADVADKIRSSKQAVDAARKELDRVKNYRELKDWASRASGLNILQAAWGSPAGVRLSQRLSAAGLGVAIPNQSLEDTILSPQ